MKTFLKKNQNRTIEAIKKIPGEKKGASKKPGAIRFQPEEEILAL